MKPRNSSRRRRTRPPVTHTAKPVELKPTVVTCSPHGRWVDRDTSTSWEPFDLAHAKRDDSQVTFCGQSTLSWSVFWELPLEWVTTRVCAICAAGARTSGEKLSAGR